MLCCGGFAKLEIPEVLGPPSLLVWEIMNSTRNEGYYPQVLNPFISSGTATTSILFMEEIRLDATPSGIIRHQNGNQKHQKKVSLVLMYGYLEKRASPLKAL